MKKTWLSRKINGITMQGEPVKDKKGGVKPYITYNPNDPRIQAHSDSVMVSNTYRDVVSYSDFANLANTDTKNVDSAISRLETHNKTRYKNPATVGDPKLRRLFGHGVGMPKQEVILKEKGIEKMPIGKLKSKSSMPEKLKGRQNMKMLGQTVMGTSGKKEVALSYQKRKRLTDNQMYSTFPGLKPSKTK